MTYIYSLFDDDDEGMLFSCAFHSQQQFHPVSKNQLYFAVVTHIGYLFFKIRAGMKYMIGKYFTGQAFGNILKSVDENEA